MFCVLKNVFKKDIDKQAGFCYTAPKTIFFSKCFEKMIFPNKYAGISCFLYYHKRQYLFSENIILVFRKKIAGYFHPKYHWNIIFSLWFLHIIWSSYEKQNLPPKKPWKMTRPLLSGELILFLKTLYCCE